MAVENDISDETIQQDRRAQMISDDELGYSRHPITYPSAGITLAHTVAGPTKSPPPVLMPRPIPAVAPTRKLIMQTSDPSPSPDPHPPATDTTMTVPVIDSPTLPSSETAATTTARQKESSVMKMKEKMPSENPKERSGPTLNTDDDMGAQTSIVTPTSESKSPHYVSADDETSVRPTPSVLVRKSTDALTAEPLPLSSRSITSSVPTTIPLSGHPKSTRLAADLAKSPKFVTFSQSPQNLPLPPSSAPTLPTVTVSSAASDMSILQKNKTASPLPASSTGQPQVSSQPSPLTNPSQHSGMPKDYESLMQHNKMLQNQVDNLLRERNELRHRQDDMLSRLQSLEQLLKLDVPQQGRSAAPSLEHPSTNETVRQRNEDQEKNEFKSPKPRPRAHDGPVQPTPSLSDPNSRHGAPPMSPYANHPAQKQAKRYRSRSLPRYVSEEATSRCPMDRMYPMPPSRYMDAMRHRPYRYMDEFYDDGYDRVHGDSERDAYEDYYNEAMLGAMHDEPEEEAWDEAEYMMHHPSAHLQYPVPFPMFPVSMMPPLPPRLTRQRSRGQSRWAPPAPPTDKPCRSSIRRRPMSSVAFAREPPPPPPPISAPPPSTSAAAPPPPPPPAPPIPYPGPPPRRFDDMYDDYRPPRPKLSGNPSMRNRGLERRMSRHSLYGSSM
ncbi:uncharacterized protein BYT42DRAFT_236538 [Radiomyces spectabilis]|uniref:uncharacterized protein n=1 Tax=Radiomyces spectabilis TaxID=64574 RepID=UPI0022204F2A|nr:uncharacterized protein BYT42DRAFT_236538 [Radiomyces spectabilis]KAI8388471.1 hypothetical protein BYT42DRAFT_236538 [Radiomyces spectabilis]